MCKRGRCAEVLQLAMGGNHACARFDDGSLRCWGGDLRGQVGDGTPNITHAVPIEVGELGKVVRVATGTNSTCAVLEDRTVQCWGDIMQRVDASARSARPLPVLSLREVVDVSVGFTSLCAVTVAGAVLCVGENETGLLGDGTKTRRSEARPVRGVSDAVEVAVSANHACARSRDGSVRCWGGNTDRQLGEAGVPQRLLPAKVPRLPPAKQLAIGGRHTCALLEDGTVRCWGANESGQLGDGSRDARTGPVQVADLSSVLAISAGRGDGTCALRADGNVRCWGNFGAFAFRRQGVQLVPQTVRDIEGVADIAVGAASFCARKRDGSVWCWGLELDPRGTPVERPKPTPLAW